MRLYPQQRRAEFHGVLHTDEPDVENSYPIAEFVYSCKRRTCTFDASPSHDDGQIVRYQWDFEADWSEGTGDGQQTSIVFSKEQYRYLPNRVFAALTVTDDRGAVAVARAYIQPEYAQPVTGTSPRDF
jgi:hypothetical protein